MSDFFCASATPPQCRSATPYCSDARVRAIRFQRASTSFHEICMCFLRVILACLTLACAASLPDGAVAQAFPSRPVRLIVPLSAGSAFDVLARAMGEAFKAGTQQPFVVENRPGGNMAIAVNACKTAPPDGYTICLLT